MAALCPDCGCQYNGQMNMASDTKTAICSALQLKLIQIGHLSLDVYAPVKLFSKNRAESIFQETAL